MKIKQRYLLALATCLLGFSFSIPANAAKQLNCLTAAELKAAIPNGGAGDFVYDNVYENQEILWTVNWVSTPIHGVEWDFEFDNLEATDAQEAISKARTAQASVIDSNVLVLRLQSGELSTCQYHTTLNPYVSVSASPWVPSDENAQMTSTRSVTQKSNKKHGLLAALHKQ